MRFTSFCPYMAALAEFCTNAKCRKHDCEFSDPAWLLIFDLFHCLTSTHMYCMFVWGVTRTSPPYAIAAILIDIHLFSKATLSASVFLFVFSFVFVELVLKLSWSLYRPSSQLALRLICIPTLQLNVSSKQIQTNSAAAHTHLRKTQQKNEEKGRKQFW